MSNILAKGIDVSYANGIIKWNLLKSNLDAQFAMIRCGYGRLATQKDKQFEANYKGAKAAGIPVGGLPLQLRNERR